MTHTLQVLHTLQWHHPGGRALLQLAQAPTQDYHSYTHALLGGVEDEDKSPSGSPVRRTREHRATKRLWPNRDATTRFPARAWREGVLLLRAQRDMLMESGYWPCHSWLKRSLLFV